MADNNAGALRIFVGMPAYLFLCQFAELVADAFGKYPELVGSAIGYNKQPGHIPRDIDVRLVLDKPEYEACVGPLAEFGQPNSRWSSFTIAFSAAGSRMTGLDVDFQIQPDVIAETHAGYPAIPLWPYRRRIPGYEPPPA